MDYYTSGPTRLRHQSLLDLCWCRTWQIQMPRSKLGKSFSKSNLMSTSPSISTLGKFPMMTSSWRRKIWKIWSRSGQKYALFFIQKGLTLNLHNDLDRTIARTKKWFMIIWSRSCLIVSSIPRKVELKSSAKMMSSTLKDTGLGIKDSDIMRVFERGFFRL